MNPEDALTTDEAAELLHIPAGTLRWWRTLNVGPPCFRLGGRKVKYLRRDLEEWLDQQYAQGLDKER